MNTNQELLNRIAELENSLALTQKRSDENFDNYKESEKNHADEIRKSMLLEYDLNKAKESIEYKDIEIARLKKEAEELRDYHSSSIESTKDLEQKDQDYGDFNSMYFDNMSFEEMNQIYIEDNPPLIDYLNGIASKSGRYWTQLEVQELRECLYSFYKADLIYLNNLNH